MSRKRDPREIVLSHHLYHLSMPLEAFFMMVRRLQELDGDLYQIAQRHINALTKKDKMLRLEDPVEDTSSVPLTNRAIQAIGNLVGVSSSCPLHQLHFHVHILLQHKPLPGHGAFTVGECTCKSNPVHNLASCLCALHMCRATGWHMMRGYTSEGRGHSGVADNPIQSNLYTSTQTRSPQVLNPCNS